MYKTKYHPDSFIILKVFHNQLPDYLPIFEHYIDVPFIPKAISKDISSENLNSDEWEPGAQFCHMAMCYGLGAEICKPD